jgi:hypothetical protein
MLKVTNINTLSDLKFAILNNHKNFDNVFENMLRLVQVQVQH